MDSIFSRKKDKVVPPPVITQIKFVKKVEAPKEVTDKDFDALNEDMKDMEELIE